MTMCEVTRSRQRGGGVLNIVEECATSGSAVSVRDCSGLVSGAAAQRGRYGAAGTTATCRSGV